MMTTTAQFVEPTVSRAKFQREIHEYRQYEDDYRARGWFLVEAAYPSVLVLMVARQLPVPILVLGVRFDYTNYDVEPPSVVLVDPFTGSPYTAAKLPVRLDRRVSGFVPPQVPPGIVVTPPAVPLMQWYGPDETPFLCLPGVREYHAHPGHSGDAWELHRRLGAGRLVRILTVIHRYGVEAVNNVQVNVQVAAQVLATEIQGLLTTPPE
jgi:hypothetical protein